MEFARRLTDFLFPERCAACKAIIDSAEIVCEPCKENIRFSHHDLDTQNLLFQKAALLFPFRAAAALMIFEQDGLSQQLIHELKYAKREKIGRIFAHWVIEREILKPPFPQKIITVPLHPHKLRKRGYNQLHLFADTLGKKYGIPVDHEAIHRERHSSAQAKKNKLARDKSQNQFKFTKNISEKEILLIDDVFTTGNTIANIAWEIRNRSACEIDILVMAMD